MEENEFLENLFLQAFFIKSIVFMEGKLINYYTSNLAYSLERSVQAEERVQRSCRGSHFSMKEQYKGQYA